MRAFVFGFLGGVCAFAVMILLAQAKMLKSSDAVPVSDATLPVVQPLRPATDTVVHTLRDDLATGKALCVSGYYARPVAQSGMAGYTFIQVDDALIPCT